MRWRTHAASKLTAITGKTQMHHWKNTNASLEKHKCITGKTQMHHWKNTNASPRSSPNEVMHTEWMGG